MITRVAPRIRVLAIALALLAGYVDALGFISLGGFFVSFMSGNSTRLGVGIAAVPAAAVVAGSLIASFVGGVTVGSLIAHASRKHPAGMVLGAVAAMLAVAAIAAGAGHIRVATLAMAVAMGIENAVFQRDGEITIGVTYVTGALVKVGQRLAEALRGKDPVGWIWYLMLWGGLVAGAAIATAVFPHWGLRGLWGAVVAALVLAVAADSRALSFPP